jgi:hypothetical protein
VFCINTRLGSLLPSHLRSLRPVYLDELGLSWPSGEGKSEASTGDKLIFSARRKTVQ